MHQAAHILIVLGAVIVVQFAGLTFSARQLAGTSVPRLRRRLMSPAVRRANVWIGAGVGVLLAGIALLPA